jgi:CelD/BcsL family acetyltransferase involved in cellulose biosynthesis
MTEGLVNASTPHCTEAASDVHIIDPCTSLEWMQFISTHPDAGIFHHPAWMRMLRDVYGYRFFAVCLKEGEKIRAGIPFADVRSFLTGKRWVSLPFSDCCVPLLSQNDSQSLETLVGFLEDHQGVETPKIEIRGSVHSAQHLFTVQNFVVHTLALEKNAEDVYKRFDRQAVKNRIAKTQREGVVVRECKTLDDFNDFYGLQLLTRKRLGVPAQPKFFFDAVWKYILEPGLGFALVSYKDDTPIGGGVFFKFGSTVYYKYGASDFAYKSLHPNHAFLWEGIRRSCVEGYRVFDFGRSEVKSAGLRNFKAGWGTVEKPLSYTFIAGDAPKIGATSTLDRMTSFVIRHSPVAVCKLSGQLLYKHFA